MLTAVTLHTVLSLAGSLPQPMELWWIRLISHSSVNIVLSAFEFTIGDIFHLVLGIA